MAEVIIRHVPGHYWIRVFVSPRVEPGHRWMYRGIIRRDAWRVGPVGFGIMRLTKSEKHWDVTEDR